MNVSNIATQLLLSGDFDPTTVAQSYPKGTLYVDTNNATFWQKQDNGSTTNWMQFDIGGGGANLTLSNLLSPTAVNQHLLPASSGTLDLGSAALSWRNIYVQTATDASSQIAVDFPNRQLRDTSSLLSVDWQARNLFASNGTTVTVDWSIEKLIDGSGNTSIFWDTRQAVDSSGLLSINWQSRVLADSAGNANLNFGTAGKVGIGITPPVGVLHVATNYVTADGSSIILETAETGVPVGTFLGRKSRGTLSAETAILNGDLYSAFAGNGFDGTSYAAASDAAIFFGANENFSGTAHGSFMQVQLTPNTTVGKKPVMRATNTSVAWFDVTGVNSVAFQVPTGATGYTLTWPSTNATVAGQVLSNDGTGHLSWMSGIASKGTGTILAAASSATITDAKISASSIVIVVLQTNDATADVHNVVPGAGTAAVNSTAVTGDTNFSYIVIN